MYCIQVYNKIAESGLSQFERKLYTISTNATNPDAILCRSENLHDQIIPPSVQVVARAGAGVNNIPLDHCTQLGIPVLNTPGANANAVKELVIAGMLLACRNIYSAWHYIKSLENSSDLHQQIEKQKKQFTGFELPGKTLAVIGLGNIGVKVANAARHLDMRVIGYDPSITIRNAWELHASVTQAHSLEEAIANADFVSIHIPLTEKTTGLFSQSVLKKIKKGAVLLNFSRDGVVDNEALITQLNSKQLAQYVCDFPNSALLALPTVICLPHLGASTAEAEINCAMMAVNQIKNYLEKGHIENSVNFPSLHLSKSEGYRLLIINKNIPNMVAQISTVISKANMNIIDMINKSKQDIACTLLDVNQPIPESMIKQLLQISGVIRARVI